MSDHGTGKAYDQNAPTFTEDDVASDFVDAVNYEIVQEVGHAVHLRRYEWAETDEDDDGTWPFVVVRDGREFEVDIDVRVTELTPERKTNRAAETEKLLAELKRHQARMQPVAQDET